MCTIGDILRFRPRFVEGGRQGRGVLCSGLFQVGRIGNSADFCAREAWSPFRKRRQAAALQNVPCEFSRFWLDFRGGCLSSVD